MKIVRLLIIVIIGILPSVLFTQTIEIDGSVKIAQMDTVQAGSTVVVRQADGTLAERMSPRLSVSAEGDTVFISNGNWIIIPGASPVADVDGNVYTTVGIGTQEWMVENLKTTKYNDGTAIPLVTDSAVWGTLSTPAYCWLNNDSAAYAHQYGALYNYYVVADTASKNVCPVGWQVPTHNDWEILKDYVSHHGHPFAGKALKASTDWIFNAVFAGTDDYRFNALPAAFRNVSGTFGPVGYETFLGSCTEYNDSTFSIRQLFYQSAYLNAWWAVKEFGFSVRCLRD